MNEMRATEQELKWREDPGMSGKKGWEELFGDIMQKITQEQKYSKHYAIMANDARRMGFESVERSLNGIAEAKQSLVTSLTVCLTNIQNEGHRE